MDIEFVAQMIKEQLLSHNFDEVRVENFKEGLVSLFRRGQISLDEFGFLIAKINIWCDAYHSYQMLDWPDLEHIYYH